jgi:hypothetical protein
MLGRIREKHVAANMTPAANPSIASSHFLVTFPVKRAGNAPTPVISPGKTSPAAIIQKFGIYATPHVIVALFYHAAMTGAISNPPVGQ